MIFEDIEKTIDTLNISTITEDRKAILQPLIDYIQDKVDNNKEVIINFICTHNSRRSHLSQIWAQTMAHFKNIRNVRCYSGGTEATAVFPKVIETLQSQGFKTIELSKSNNPIYSVRFNQNALPIIGFSKTYDNAFNPQSEFAAVMTCSQADTGCPFIAGAEKRIPITYEDPKLFDDTKQQNEKYLERSLQIASEMLYVFSSIKKA